VSQIATKERQLQASSRRCLGQSGLNTCIIPNWPFLTFPDGRFGVGMSGKAAENLDIKSLCINLREVAFSLQESHF
jgi:hypothetical protein